MSNRIFLMKSIQQQTMINIVDYNTNNWEDKAMPGYDQSIVTRETNLCC